MKRLLLIVFIIMLSISLISCGEEDPEEMLNDFVSSFRDSEEYDFGIEVTENFGLSPVFEAREYVDLIDLEDEFREVLKDCVAKAELGDFDFNDDFSLKDMLDVRKKNDPEGFDEEAYNNVEVSCMEKSDGDEDCASIDAKIIHGSDKDIFYHYGLFIPKTELATSARNYSAIRDQIEKVIGVKVDSSKIEEAFSAIEEISMNDDRVIAFIQTKEIDNEKYKETIEVEVSGYYDEESGHEIGMSVLRYRWYII